MLAMEGVLAGKSLHMAGLRPQFCTIMNFTEQDVILKGGDGDRGNILL